MIGFRPIVIDEKRRKEVVIMFFGKSIVGSNHRSMSILSAKPRLIVEVSPFTCIIEINGSNGTNI